MKREDLRRIMKEKEERIIKKYIEIMEKEEVKIEL